MTDRFDELVGDDLPPEERERLLRVHELLLAADPPPELPPTLASSPDKPELRLLPRRRRVALALVAAGLVAAAFGGGYLVGAGSGERETDFVVSMTGTAEALDARASLAVFAKDDAGNWPMRLTVLGLPPGSYELWLTKNGRLAARCGRFAVRGAETRVELNAPYRFKRFNGWVVTPVGDTSAVLTT